jgi:hypothetical protein
MLVRFQIEIKGISSQKGIPTITRILQIYMDNFAHCFGLDIAVELMDWRESSDVSVPIVQDYTQD